MLATTPEVKPRRRGGRPQLTQEQFIERSRAKHGDRYDYSLVVYTRTRDKVTIICPEHGEFRQGACEHMAGQGCKKCSRIENGIKLRKGNDRFIAEAIAVHGVRYDYSMVSYSGAHNKVTIICHAHGPFEQSPHSHLKGQNCPVCGDLAAREFSRSRNTGLDGFVSRSRETHGDKYDYSLVQYIDANSKVRIICPVHGEFIQQAGAHMREHGCFRCAADRKADATRRSVKQFVAEAREVHGDKFDYSKVDYTNIGHRVTITCPVHGDFEQVAAAHLSGRGCIKCSSTGPSAAELEMAEYLEGLGVEIRHGDRKVIRPYELDIYAKEIGLAVEFNGFYWHCDKHREPGYSRMKHDLALKAGVDLMSIWEYDWQRERTQRVWKRILAERVGAAKSNLGLAFIEVDETTASQFLRRYWLRAAGDYDKVFGLHRDGALKSVMTFRHRRGNEWAIIDWANSEPLLGCEQRIFNNATDALEATIVWAKTPREMIRRRTMQDMGFEFYDELPPVMRVWHDKIGLRSEAFWSPENMPKVMPLVPKHRRRDHVSPDEMKEFQDSVRARRIYDAGHIRWVWRR